MAEAPNPAQLAPGEEAAEHPIDDPVRGFDPGQHVGYPLNQSFWMGAQFGRA